MQKNKEKLSGVFPPIMTPFINQEVAYDKLAENIEKYNATNLRGYMPLGSNGEFRSLTEEESIRVVDVVSKRKGPNKTLIAGAGRDSAWACLDFIKKIADRGVDFATLLTPHFFASAMTDDALIQHYTYVADRSPIPVMIYIAPKFAAGVQVSPHVISVLSKHSNIAGMKDTSKEDISTYINAVSDKENFHVLAGTVSKFYKGLQAGAIGGVLSMANYLPDMCCELQEVFLSGDQMKCSALDERLRSLGDKSGGKSGIPGVKAAMDLLGYFGGEPRIPLFPLPEAARNELKAALQQEGLL